jgi:hypothetical protein
MIDKPFRASRDTDRRKLQYDAHYKPPFLYMYRKIGRNLVLEQSPNKSSLSNRLGISQPISLDIPH